MLPKKNMVWDFNNTPVLTSASVVYHEDNIWTKMECFCSTNPDLIIGSKEYFTYGQGETKPSKLEMMVVQSHRWYTWNDCLKNSLQSVEIRCSGGNFGIGTEISIWRF